MNIEVKNIEQTLAFARQVGSRLGGGEVFELVGDVGAGKTTFAKGLGNGLEITDDVQSPSFTLSRVYDARDGLKLHHYDFYRLGDAGILAYELAESVSDYHVITVVEWAATVADVLPLNTCVLTFSADASSENKRIIVIDNPNKAIEEAYAVWSKNR
ncbi:tRNA (adenosine(37)-N6)-threonylcarbamoyltransferase complex ATPase subunit type 1 TsaE [Candidatus Saccharibacteria bacterium]|nr:tRNA (adenosine(37)-N6)-threonylcarbamoyltransferase complex ATPase subunit type 1 TsaE [Candidatus Saccharibacteria bacterium]NCU40588.1 tRNA (adenosine(37)-N6)-threonylcarbamoyltransferase complex ATPase subunit type 1 TsaE [Candidatus Saccharibacteria bacterium]